MWHYMHSLSKNLHFLSRWSVLQFGKVTFPLPWCVWQKYQKQRSFWKNEIIIKTETKWRKVEYVYNITVYLLVISGYGVFPPFIFHDGSKMTCFISRRSTSIYHTTSCWGTEDERWETAGLFWKITMKNNWPYCKLKQNGNYLAVDAHKKEGKVCFNTMLNKNNNNYKSLRPLTCDD